MGGSYGKNIAAACLIEVHVPGALDHLLFVRDKPWGTTFHSFQPVTLLFSIYLTLANTLYF